MTWRQMQILPASRIDFPWNAVEHLQVTALRIPSLNTGDLQAQRLAQLCPIIHFQKA